MYSHLAQYQSSCWKHWDISVPNALFEKKELERTNPSLLGWWGPAKGVPMLVFIAANVSYKDLNINLCIHTYFLDSFYYYCSCCD